jgi:hypothetical protein
VQTTTATVMFMSIETDRARCVINASTTYYGCKFTNGLYTSLAVAYMGWCYIGSSYNYGIDCINNGQITLHWCKLLFTTNAIRIMIHSRLNCRGTVVRGPSGSTGLNLWVNSACDFWSNDDYGKTFVQNWSTGVSLLTGTMTSNAGGFITYSSCSTNYTAAASSYAYYG